MVTSTSHSRLSWSPGYCCWSETAVTFWLLLESNPLMCILCINPTNPCSHSVEKKNIELDLGLVCLDSEHYSQMIMNFFPVFFTLNDVSIVVVNMILNWTAIAGKQFQQMQDEIYTSILPLSIQSTMGSPPSWICPEDKGRRPGRTLIRCMNHLSWLLSTWRRRGSTPHPISKDEPNKPREETHFGHRNVILSVITQRWQRQVRVGTYSIIHEQHPEILSFCL